MCEQMLSRVVPMRDSYEQRVLNSCQEAVDRGSDFDQVDAAGTDVIRLLRAGRPGDAMVRASACRMPLDLRGARTCGCDGTQLDGCEAHGGHELVTVAPALSSIGVHAGQEARQGAINERVFGRRRSERRLDAEQQARLLEIAGHDPHRFDEVEDPERAALRERVAVGRADRDEVRMLRSKVSAAADVAVAQNPADTGRITTARMSADRLVSAGHRHEAAEVLRTVGVTVAGLVAERSARQVEIPDRTTRPVSVPSRAEPESEPVPVRPSRVALPVAVLAEARQLGLRVPDRRPAIVRELEAAQAGEQSMSDLRAKMSAMAAERAVIDRHLARNAETHKLANEVRAARAEHTASQVSAVSPVTAAARQRAIPVASR